MAKGDLLRARFDDNLKVFGLFEGEKYDLLSDTQCIYCYWEKRWDTKKIRSLVFENITKWMGREVCEFRLPTEMLN